MPANTTNAMLNRLQDPTSSSSTMTVKSKDDGIVIDNSHLLVKYCPTGLDRTEPTMDNYGANFDNAVAKNQPKLSDTTYATDTFTSKANCHHHHHHHQLHPSMLA